MYKVNRHRSILSRIITESRVYNRRHVETRSSLLPEILCTPELEDQTPKENECILEEDGDTRVDRRFLRHDESSKQDPHGGDEGAKSQHEANEEPHSSACLSHAAFAVAVSSHLAIGNSIYHEKRHRSYDPTRMVGMMKLSLPGVFHCSVDDDPPTSEEQDSSSYRSDGVSSLSPVHIALTVSAPDSVQKS